jgi:hypothetical protein
MNKLITQPTLAPTRKVAAAGITLPISVLITWGLGMAGIPVPPEVASALATVLAALAAYLVKERAPNDGEVPSA